jgi:putative ABC transport system permease protein
MKTIDVQEQPILSFGRTLHIALAGVKYRLFRAIVTVAVIAVAMAFLMNILSESLIKKSVAISAREQIDELHRTDKWIAKLSVPQSYEELIATLASPGAFSEDRQLFMTGISEDQVEPLRELGRQANLYLTFFNNLNYGRRRVLVGSAASTRIFDVLQPPEAQQSLFAALEKMKSVRFPTGPEPFASFLKEWPQLKAYMTSVRDRQQQAVDQVQDALNGRPMLTAMQDANGDFGAAIRQAGFDLSDQEAASLVRQSERVADNKLIGDTINNPAIRQAVAARYDKLPGDVTLNMIWSMLEDTGNGTWYIEQMREANIQIPERLNPERMAELAEGRARARLLIKTELMTTEAGGGFMGIGQRMTWLAFVSMLVCVVGIANAMLMSVTERFREIATLKCLGALDGFIMTVFLIEASILGLVGGVVGTLVGLILCILRMLIIFGPLVTGAFPLSQLMTAGLISIVVGILLAAVAAVYPSFRAAQLAPMEAMRIE